MSGDLETEVSLIPSEQRGHWHRDDRADRWWIVAALVLLTGVGSAAFMAGVLSGMWTDNCPSSDTSKRLFCSAGWHSTATRIGVAGSLSAFLLTVVLVAALRGRRLAVALAGILVELAVLATVVRIGG